MVQACCKLVFLFLYWILSGLDWQVGFYLYCLFFLMNAVRIVASYVSSFSERPLASWTQTCAEQYLIVDWSAQGDSTGEPWRSGLLNSQGPLYVSVYKTDVRKRVVLSVHLKCFVHNIYSHKFPDFSCHVRRYWVFTVSSYCRCYSYSCSFSIITTYYFFFLLFDDFEPELFTHH